MRHDEALQYARTLGVKSTEAATALATAGWMLVASRLIGGAMQANAAVANAYAADITPPEERARSFGLLGAMFGIGFILGPVMGGLLGAIQIKLPFYTAGVLALLNLAYGYFVLPESLPPERRSGGAALPRGSRARRAQSLAAAAQNGAQSAGCG